MTILLTGASGLVGSAFARAASQQGHQVTGIVHRHGGVPPGVERCLTLDLGETEGLERVVRSRPPDAIVNAAAISEPAACEADPAGSHRLNVGLPSALAVLARKFDLRLVHLSSEQVFSGHRAPYRPDDPVDPITLYGRQKVQSELAVQTEAPSQAVTLRAPLLGGNSLTGRRSLHERLFLEWSEGRTPRLFIDEWRQVCHADQLACVLLALCDRRSPCGVVHWAGAETLSRHELGLRIRAHFQLEPAHAPLAAASLRDAGAPSRQPDLSLDVSILQRLLRLSPETFSAQLAQLKVPAAHARWYSQTRYQSS